MLTDAAKNCILTRQDNEGTGVLGLQAALQSPCACCDPLLQSTLVMAESLSLRGTLEGHKDWVTSIATPLDPNSDTILSASRWVMLASAGLDHQLQP